MLAISEGWETYRGCYTPGGRTASIGCSTEAKGGGAVPLQDEQPVAVSQTDPPSKLGKAGSGFPARVAQPALSVPLTGGPDPEETVWHGH